MNILINICRWSEKNENQKLVRQTSHYETYPFIAHSYSNRMVDGSVCRPCIDEDAVSLREEYKNEEYS